MVSKRHYFAAKLTKMENFVSSAFFRKKLKAYAAKIMLAQSIKA